MRAARARITRISCHDYKKNKYEVTTDSQPGKRIREVADSKMRSERGGNATTQELDHTKNLILEVVEFVCKKRSSTKFHMKKFYHSGFY